MDGTSLTLHHAALCRKPDHPGGQRACLAPAGLWLQQFLRKLVAEGIVSKRLGSRYRSGRSPDWLKFKNPAARAVKREAEEDWGR
jgi:hypothetical protein